MSFNIALSGLDATNTELNTISHNIATHQRMVLKVAAQNSLRYTTACNLVV